MVVQAKKTKSMRTTAKSIEEKTLSLSNKGLNMIKQVLPVSAEIKQTVTSAAIKAKPFLARRIPLKWIQTQSAIEVPKQTGKFHVNVAPVVKSVPTLKKDLTAGSSVLAEKASNGSTMLKPSVENFESKKSMFTEKQSSPKQKFDEHLEVPKAQEIEERTPMKQSITASQKSCGDPGNCYVCAELVTCVRRKELFKQFED